MAERFPKLSPETLTPAQAALVQSIAGSRGGEGQRGPFTMWLRAPELGNRMQQVGQYIRYQATLPQKLVELAICITAREWNAAYEWHAHAKLARQEGLADAVLKAVAERRRPESMDEGEAAVWDFCTELHRDRVVGDARFAAVKALFGEEGATELTLTCGYYVAVAMTLNVAEAVIPDGAVAFG